MVHGCQWTEETALPFPYNCFASPRLRVSASPRLRVSASPPLLPCSPAPLRYSSVDSAIAPNGKPGG